jgi:cell division protein FtsB
MFVFYGIFSCYKTNAKLTAQVNELAMQISLLNDENMQLKSFINEHYLNNEKKDVENLIV